MSKDICVIGCGGIGSWLASFVNRAQLNKQLEGDFTFIDDDIVEAKNIPYQNFEVEDVMKNKAEVIGDKLLFDYQVTRLEKPEDLKAFDLVVIAADNSKVRRMVYEHAKDWIDLRSKGRIVSVFRKSEKNTPKVMEETLGSSDEPTSCQNKNELKANIIQYGNLIAASIGVQMLVNEERSKANKDYIKESDSFTHMF